MTAKYLIASAAAVSAFSSNPSDGACVDMSNAEVRNLVKDTEMPELKSCTDVFQKGMCFQEMAKKACCVTCEGSDGTGSSDKVYHYYADWNSNCKPKGDLDTKGDDNSNWNQVCRSESKDGQNPKKYEGCKGPNNNICCPDMYDDAACTRGNDAAKNKEETIYLLAPG